jgi:hypothetical protein
MHGKRIRDRCAGSSLHRPGLMCKSVPTRAAISKQLAAMRGAASSTSIIRPGARRATVASALGQLPNQKQPWTSR